MFKELIEAFKKHDVLNEMVQQLGEMLDAGQWMFDTACDVVQKKLASEEIRDELYRRDRMVNRLEYRIRERLVVHLATTSRPQDVGMSLVLMSVVKDAERIGDYCKNIYELSTLFRRDYSKQEFTVPLDEIRQTIHDLFPRIRRAFVQGDKKSAEAAIEEALKARQKCEFIIKQLMTPGSQGAADEAVAYALRARFFKRVISHLANIATSVNNPVPALDFRRGKPLDEPG